MNWTEEINTAVDILLDGGVILYPTDTIWGLGSDILHQEAVEKIYSLKKRERWQPLILLVSSIDMLKSYAINIHPRLENLLNVHGQPLTVIYDQVMGIPSYLRAKNGSVGIRICTDPYCIQLIEALGRPITSTSANLSGQPFLNILVRCNRIFYSKWILYAPIVGIPEKKGHHLSWSDVIPMAS
ncbi:MAG: L-threonylcarbamoyladenylate synthase [Saprospiraceae bacterium]|nr:L-threonylcarbamoyladenylate synthase [Saprospiraceae bacterium]